MYMYMELCTHCSAHVHPLSLVSGFEDADAPTLASTVGPSLLSFEDLRLSALRLSDLSEVGTMASREFMLLGPWQYCHPLCGTGGREVLFKVSGFHDSL